VMNQIGNKRLLIVADGFLQYIPFNALQNPNETTKYSPLILTNEIITLPSASTVISLRENNRSKTTNSKQIAVIADPIFTQDDERVKLSKTPNKKVNGDLGQLALNRSIGNTSLQLDRLKATRQEAEAIKKLIPEKEQIQVLDFAANLNFVKTQNLADYKIIHFATHGIANSNNPELSGLVLSLFDNQGNPENGFLRLNDIFNLKLNADLVVLSACQTGLGKQVKGEGLVGLTRGFMYAGSPRVVVSLWSVDDQGTSILMSRFYQLMLEKKLPVSAALRQAQIEMLQQENYKLPYYWAAFTMQGEWK
jgi:CHAT domain-containing protein